MKLFRILLFVLLLAAFLPSFAADSDAVKLIKAYYVESNALIRAKDSKHLTELLQATLTDDFAAILPDRAHKERKISKSDDISETIGLLTSAYTFDKAVTHVDHIDVSKASAEVMISQTFELTSDRSSVKKHKLSIIGKAKYSWVKIADRWRIKTVRILSNVVISDGKKLKT